MPHLPIDAFDNPGAWTALDPDGAPSGQLSLAADSQTVRFGVDGVSGLLSATASAAQHRLRRTLPAPLDLRPYDELRLWVQGDLPADGSGQRPFLLQLRLGSAALPPGDGANTWARFLPLSTPGSWELLRLSLQDLAGDVRSATTTLEIRCVASPVAFTVHLDDLIAVRAELVADADAGLLDRLHNRFRLGGADVPAFVANPDTPEPALPHIRITPYGLRRAVHGQNGVERRADYVNGGHALLPPAVGYELYYEIEGRAATHADTARLFDFVLRTLAPWSHLLINDVQHRIEMLDFPLHESDGPGRAERLLLRFKLYSRLETGAAQPARTPYNEVIIDTKHW